MEYHRAVKIELVGKYQILLLKKLHVAKGYVTVYVKQINIGDIGYVCI